jgi:signal transduction histidine kinase/ligand-binding sensor domain-containing protein
MRTGWRLRDVVVGLLAAFGVALGTPLPVTATDLPGVLTDYTITSWGQRDGFPLGSTWAIAQDEDGYLWLGTDAGLFRFDGVRFLPWTPPEADPPLRGSIRSLLSARDGSLWIGFGDAGRAVRVQDGRPRIYGETEGLPRAAVTSLVEDADHTIWAVTSRGLFALRDERFQRVGPEVGLPDTPIYGLRVDPRGRLVVGTGAGIFRRVESSPRFELLSPSVQEGVPRAFTDDGSGALYVTDSILGFRSVGDAAPGAPDPMRRGRGYALFRDSHNNMWVGTLGQGLWRVRPRPTTSLRPGPGGDFVIERVTELTGLSSDGVLALMEDRDGNLWVGTSEGLNRLVPRRIIRVTDLGLVTGVESAADGHVWVGTIDELVRFSAADPASPLARVRLPGSRLATMHADGDALWAVTNRGIVGLTGRDGTLRPVTGTESLRQVSALANDKDGRLWLYDQTGGLFSLRQRRLEPFGLPEERRADRIALMHVDSTGRLWLAFASGQLGEVVAGVLKIHDGGSGFEPSLVHAIHEDRDRVIWFARTDGLSRYADGRFVTLTRDKGFPLRNLTGLVEDQRDNFWIGSNLGIARISRAEIDKAFAAGRADTIQYTLFDRSDGIASTPRAVYSLGRPAAMASDGRVWFVTGAGVTIIDPKTLETVRPPAPVRVERVIANDTTFEAAPGVTLPARSSSLQIDYTVVNLTSPFRTNFRYKLEGFDADWITAGPRRQAFYTNLPPRPYRFVVVARNSEGMPLSETAWEFAIAPMFYQTRWFSAALVALVALAGWGAWRLRLRQVRREFSLLLHERTRLSREIHDTLLQSLVGIALQFDALAGELPAAAGRTRDQLVRMRKQVEEHIREARHSIWNLRSPTLRRRDLGTALRAFAEQATESAGIAVDVDINGAPPRRVPRVEEQLLRIGQEAVSNAVRHSGASRIRIRLDYRPDDVTLRVADDGRGFDFAALQREPNGHYGLITMRERAAEIGGSLLIESRPPAGTEITAVVPQSARVEEPVDVGT